MYHRLLDRRPPGIPTTLEVPGSGSASTDVLTPRRMIQVKIDLDECKPVGKVLDVSEKWTEVTSLEEEVERFVKAIHMQRMAKMKSDSLTSESATSSSTSSQPKHILPINRPRQKPQALPSDPLPHA